MNLLIGLITGLLVGWVAHRMLDPDPRLSRRTVLLVGALAAGISSAIQPVFDASGGGNALIIYGIVSASAVAGGAVLLLGAILRRYGHD